MTTLYHFTSTHHLAYIMAHGRLMTTDSDVSKDQYAAHMCVWCTTDPDPGGKHGLGLSRAVNKEEVRFTLEVPDDLVHEWDSWAASQSIEAGWRRFLVKNAGGVGVTDTWRLIFQSVPSSMWVAVENLVTGEKYDITDAGHDLNEKYFDFTEANVCWVVPAIQSGLRDGIISVAAEHDVCALLAEGAVGGGVIPLGQKADFMAWLKRSHVPVMVLNAVYVSASGGFKTGHLTDGTVAVVYSPRPQVPQMNRSQRRAMAKSKRRVA